MTDLFTPISIVQQLSVPPSLPKLPKRQRTYDPKFVHQVADVVRSAGPASATATFSDVVPGSTLRGWIARSNSIAGLPDT